MEEVAFVDGDIITIEVHGQTFSIALKTVPNSLNTTRSYFEIARTATSEHVATAFEALLSNAIASGTLQGSVIKSVSVKDSALSINVQSASPISLSIVGNRTIGATASIHGINHSRDLLDDTASYATAITTTPIQEQIDPVGDILTLNAGMVEEGYSYRIQLDGQNYEYVAYADDTINDVADGLKMALDAAAIQGLTVSIDYVDNPLQYDVSIHLQLIDGSISNKALTTITVEGGHLVA